MIKGTKRGAVAWTAIISLIAGCAAGTGDRPGTVAPGSAEALAMRPMRLEQVENARSFMPGMETVLHADVKLPANFRCYRPMRSGGWDPMDGFLWMDAETARQLARASPITLDNLDGPMIWVRQSDSATQTPGTDWKPQLDRLVGTLTQAGLRDARSRTLAWGPHPVYSLTATRPDGSPVRVAWVGLNTPMGWTLLVDYKLPRGVRQPSPAQTAIWTDLLERSQGTSAH